MVKFDAPHVFRVFDGPSGLIAVLDKHCPSHGLQYSAVQMWKQRGRIPATWWGAVLYCIEKEGHHCIEFLFDDDELGGP